MLTINDLKSGVLVMIDGAPYQILEVAHQHIGRGGSSIQTKIKNIKTGQVLSRNFKPADSFEEADIEKRPVTFLYTHRGEYVFQDLPKPSVDRRDTDPKNLETYDPKKRFSLMKDMIGEGAKWLKPNIELTVLFLDGKPLTVVLPIKIDFQVAEAPPGVQGDRSQAGTKTVTLENGTTVQAPLFIDQGDIIRINTQTGKYVERVEKA